MLARGGECSNDEIFDWIKVRRCKSKLILYTASLMYIKTKAEFITDKHCFSEEKHCLLTCCTLGLPYLFIWTGYLACNLYKDFKNYKKRTTFKRKDQL